ncbi:MAG: ABC transporter substrate-binding protein [Candidatus Methylacidiphilales bacterium]|nr:hypothetical protein [Candidatus Methylacidiphilales bacterium]
MSSTDSFAASSEASASSASAAVLESPSDIAVQKPAQNTTKSIDEILFTRCPVPTATGIAYNLGWLGEHFKPDGINIATIQDSPALWRHHYDHDVPHLIREGGNVLALAARAQGAPTRLIGLTWIEEGQAILVRPGSGITEPGHLKGRRLALPTYVHNSIPSHVRGTSISRAMSLHGYKGALAFAGLTFDDVDFVEVDGGNWDRPSATPPDRNGSASPAAGVRARGWWALTALLECKVDAVYVKGAAAADAARLHGAIVGIDLDRLPNRRFRVNNGTPRPITVHENLLRHHPDIVTRFLVQTLRAADWAAGHLPELQQILQAETSGSGEGVAAAYREGFHLTLHPDLSDERLELLEQQKKFLWLQGFQDFDFSLRDWVARAPLDAAYALREELRKGGRWL